MHIPDQIYQKRESCFLLSLNLLSKERSCNSQGRLPACPREHRRPEQKEGKLELSSTWEKQWESISRHRHIGSHPPGRVSVVHIFDKRQASGQTQQDVASTCGWRGEDEVADDAGLFKSLNLLLKRFYVKRKISHFFFAPPGDEHQGPEGAATDGSRVLQGHGGGTHPPRLP